MALYKNLKYDLFTLKILIRFWGGPRGKMLIVQNIKYDLSTLKFHFIYSQNTDLAKSRDYIKPTKSKRVASWFNLLLLHNQDRAFAVIIC